MADVALVTLVALAAFLISSYAARNSDLFLHLGAGRLIATGGFSFGNDVLSFTGADRVWVNHTWLFEVLAYFLFKADASGGMLVIVKALSVMVAMTAIVACRREKNALWPWAAFAALAVVTMAPHLNVRPIVASMLFLSITLFVIFRLPWKHQWRNPAILGGLFALWSNTDSWFVLGPLTVFLVWVGEVIQESFLPGTKTEETADIPLTVPPTKGLLKALLVGVLACMVNPYHIHVWEVPAEFGLGFPVEIAADNDLRVLLLSPASPSYFENESLGYNINGFAYAVLFLGSGFTLAAGFRRVRVAHLLLWTAFAYLGFRQLQLALFFAPMAALLAPAYINAMSKGIVLTTWVNRKSRFILTASGVGRLICVPLALAMVVFAWPGWLHTKPTVPAQVRRVQWIVEPDPGLERTAKQFQTWHSTGALNKDTHGLSNSIHLGNYCAWFAPDEKVFVNSRFNFHKPELPNYLALRKAMTPSKESGVYVESDTIKTISDNHKTKYLSIVPVSTANSINGATLVLMMRETNQVWRVWSANGRAFILGIDKPDAPAIDYSPIQEAFGTNVVDLPAGPTTPPAPPRTWLEDFTLPLKPVPIQADDTTITGVLSAEYARVTATRRSFLQQMHNTRGGPLMGYIMQPPAEPGDRERALALLGLRYARQSVAANPDAYESYQALIDAYANPALPELWPEKRSQSADGKRTQIVEPGEQTLQRMTAYVRYLARVPVPEECKQDTATRAFQIALSLAQLHKELNQLDAARERVKQALTYYPYGVDKQNQIMLELAKGQGEKVYKEEKKRLEDEQKYFKEVEKSISQEVVNATTQLDRLPKELPPDRKLQATLQVGLFSRAIEDFRKTKLEDYGDARLSVVATILSVELAMGRIEEAAQDAKDFFEGLDTLRKNDPARAGQADVMIQRVRPLQYRIDVVAGRYADARANWLQINSPLPKLSAEDKQAVMSFPRERFVPPELTQVAGFHVMILHTVLLTNISQKYEILESEGQFLYHRGILDMIQGNRAEAQRSFEMAIAPQGITTVAWPWVGNCKQFLRLYKIAEGQ